MSKTLEEIAHIYSGCDYKKNPPGDSVPIYGTGGLLGFTSTPLYKGPAVLSGRKGSINNPIYVEGPFWNVDTIFCIKANVGINTKWLFYNFLNTDLSQLNEATGVPSVNSKALYKLKFEWFELPEQTKIADILSTCDAVIDKVQASIEKYKAIKQGMLHDLFTRGIEIKTGKLRPKYEDAPHLYKESKLGIVPLEWEVETVEETTLKIADRDHFTPIYFDSGIPIISPKDFEENEEISFTKCRYISYEAHLKNSEKTDLKEGDLVFTRIGALLGKVCMVEDWMPEFSILHSACMIRVNPKSMDGKFYLQFIKSYFFQSQIKIEIQSIGVPDLGLEKIKSFLVFRPSLAEQQEIGKRLGSIDSLIKNETLNITKKKHIKEGLMHDLLSGMKKVKIAELTELSLTQS